MLGMTALRESLWTIDELGARVALALSVNYEGQSNGKVRDVPDRRTIRYYTTLGLLDRAASMCGRTALYGRRHLMQLVAIKRLQARGCSLVEVQEQLVGATDAALARLARLPTEEREPRGVPTSQRDEAFWKAAPAAVSEAISVEAEAAVLPLQGLELARGLTLLLAAARSVESDDVEAIRAAAAPLLELLKKRRLLEPPQERRNT
jgi:DNA-binding transcriptional MerR regulator